MSIIGPTTYGVLKNLVQPDLTKEKRYKDLVKVLVNMPQPLVITEMFKFNKRNQKQGESVN